VNLTVYFSASTSYYGKDPLPVVKAAVAAAKLLTNRKYIKTILLHIKNL
jgi:alpha-L-fucosidase 2